jgi:hypothetical protein
LFFQHIEQIKWEFSKLSDRQAGNFLNFGGESLEKLGAHGKLVRERKGSGLLLGMTKEELAVAIAKFWGLRCEGKSDDEIMDQMGLTRDQFDRLNKALVDSMGELLRTKSKEEVFLDYIADQKSCLKDLEAISDPDEFRKSKQWSAYVGAVRARSEIHKEILRAGQELGVIQRAPTTSRKEVVGGVVFAELSSDQLKKAIAREMTGLDEMMKTFGEGTIIEIEPGEVHRRALPEPTIKTKATSKSQKAKRTKRVTGRKAKG